MHQFRSEYLVAQKLALEIFWDEERFVGVHIQWSEGVQEKYSSTPESLRQAFHAYAQGKPVTFPELPFAWDQLRPFSRRVLQTLYREVPYGQTVTYGQLAVMAGSPRAARAVGQIMSKNPWPLLVPCHRVLGSNQSLCGFSGGGGVALKQYLLELEGAAV